MATRVKEGMLKDINVLFELSCARVLVTLLPNTA